MKRAAAVAFVALACGRDRPPASIAPLAAPVEPASVAPSGPAVSDAVPSGQGLLTGWLSIQGHRIQLPDGTPFHGRGANVHDTRSCDSCAFEPPHPSEVMRRIDALTDDWHANFIRLLLESYPDDGRAKVGVPRAHYRSVLDDEAYFEDVLHIIAHAGKKKGVYVLVSLWQDASFGPLGWPTGRTVATWRKLATALRDTPYVLFGLVNEPQANDDGKRDAEVWQAMNETVAAIRSVERPERRHVITVQGTREWGRSLDYYVEHPITAGGGVNIAYETHVYNRPDRFDELVVRPAKKLPVIVGEVGPQADGTMLQGDCTKLFDVAEKHGVPWIAWSFHNNCPPNLLVERKNACVVGAGLEPSAWGRIVRERLRRAW